MSTTSSANTNNDNFDPTAASSITYQSLSSSATTVSASPTSPTTQTTTVSGSSENDTVNRIIVYRCTAIVSSHTSPVMCAKGELMSEDLQFITSVWFSTQR